MDRPEVAFEGLYLRAGGVVEFVHFEVVATGDEHALVGMERGRVNGRGDGEFSDFGEGLRV